MLGHTKILLCLFVVLVSVSLQACSKPTKRYRYDAEFLDSEIQRIRAGKAGQEIEPIWTVTKSSRVIKEADQLKHNVRTDDENSENSESYEYGDGDGDGDEEDYTSSEEIEITCAPGKGWHTRGQRCVPLNCPGGPAERDFNTGECLYVHHPKGGRFSKPFQQWNDLNHVYRSNPMSTHFVRSMILMRKG